MRISLPLLLAALLLLGAAPAVAAPAPSASKEVSTAASDLAHARAALDFAERRLAALQYELRRKEMLHTHFVARLEELKSGPIQAFRLESLQRTAREMAEQRTSLQREVQTAQAEVEHARSVVRQRAEQRLAELEQQQPTVPEQRLAWVQQQQELLELLRRMQPAGNALPPIPRGEVRSSDGPEELREMADELSDVGEQYLARAAALAERITELVKQQRLSKLAQDLAREEGLFDEGMRYRKVERVTLVQRTDTGTHTPTAETGTSPPGKTLGPTNGAGEGPAGREDDHGGSWSSDGAPGAYSGAGGSSSDSPSVPVTTPVDVPQPSGLDGGPAYEHRVGVKEDPGLGIADPHGGALQVETQLRLLQRQQQQAASRAQDALRKAKALRERAQQLERQEK